MAKFILFRKINAAYFLRYFIIVAFLLWAPTEVRGDRCDWDDHNNYTCSYDFDDVEISTGAIIGVVIGAIILFIVIPTLICFCCAWACFRGRRSKGEVHTYIVPAPQPGSYPSQPTDPNQQQQPPYNHYGSNNTQQQGTPPGYGGYNMAPPPYYGTPPQPGLNQQNPPYPIQNQNNPPPPQAGWQA